jgi:excinuclease ABC subunit A
LIVVTGVSGSGKSSLTIDTVYAEGQRRYAESLSAYVRQFLNRMDKPDVDYIKGLAPAIAIEQKVITRTPRSTVGSMTEIYDYLRLLYARIGKTISPVSGREVKKDDVKDVLDAIKHERRQQGFILAAFKHTATGRSGRTEYPDAKRLFPIYVSPFSKTQKETPVTKAAPPTASKMLSGRRRRFY